MDSRSIDPRPGHAGHVVGRDAEVVDRSRLVDARRRHGSTDSGCLSETAFLVTAFANRRGGDADRIAAAS